DWSMAVSRRLWMTNELCDTHQPSVSDPKPPFVLTRCNLSKRTKADARKQLRVRCAICQTRQPARHTRRAESLKAAAALFLDSSLRRPGSHAEEYWRRREYGSTCAMERAGVDVHDGGSEH